MDRNMILRLWQQLPIGSLKYSGMWFAFCSVLHMLWGWATPEVLPQFLSKMTNVRDRRDWYNRGVSIVHAGIMFVRAVVYWSLLNADMELPRKQDELSRFGGFDQITLDIMMGYLWYDILIEATKDTLSKTTLLHHIVGYVSLFATRATGSKLGSFYFMLVFCAEGSTPVLHTLWLLHKLDCTQWALYRVLAAVLLLLFFLLRVVLGPYTIHHLVSHRALWAQEGQDGQWLYSLLLAISVVFVSINYYWFYLLVKMALPKRPKRAPAKKE